MDNRTDIPDLTGRPFTIENLQDDRACNGGRLFGDPLIEAGRDVPLALIGQARLDYFSWALDEGYDLSSAWREPDGSDYSFTWDADGRITSTAGEGGVARAGSFGLAKAGFEGVALAGYQGKAIADLGGLALSRIEGTSEAAESGVAISEGRGTSRAGRSGISVTGWKGSSESEDYGISVSGIGGKARAGVGGVLVLRRESDWTYRCAQVDGTTIKADTWYRLDADGNFVEAADE
jgi:hypothetical protein